jgi:RHS repeat-associated protein
MLRERQRQSATLDGGLLVTDTLYDSAGSNAWTYGYDLRGRQTRKSDPDKGVTVSGYNDADELIATTDSRGETLAYGYDALGRKRSVRDDSPTGTLRAEWVYDGLARGQLDKSVRYVDGAAYVNAVTAYDDAYQPTQQDITVPGADHGMTRMFSYVQGYRLNGDVDTTRLPAAGDLKTETLLTGYDNLGQATTLDTNLTANGLSTPLVYATRYTPFGEVTLVGRQTGDAGWVDSVFYYEEGTRRLKRSFTTRQTNPSLVTDLSYRYDPSGNVTRIGDTPPDASAPPPTGPADTQCFTYDYLRRLTEAWTPAGGDCAAARSMPALGGPAPYWQSFGYDRTGNRTTSTERTPTATNNRTYAYPSAATAHPHALQSVTSNGTAGPTYGYDSTGNTVTQPGPAGNQTLTWDAEGHLASSTDSTGTTTYIYDADGNRVIRRDPAGQTIYLPGQEIRVPASTSTTTTRYYQHAGQTVAMRTAAGITWLVNDPQGTAEASLDAATQAAVARRQTPFGTPRGATISWPNDKGFVGGTVDNTGLTHLGAREYDPNAGRFISVDPVIDSSDPQQMNGYAYANNTPVTASDPDGQQYSCKFDDCAPPTPPSNPKPPAKHKTDNGQKSKHKSGSGGGGSSGRDNGRRVRHSRGSNRDNARGVQHIGSKRGSGNDNARPALHSPNRIDWENICESAMPTGAPSMSFRECGPHERQPRSTATPSPIPSQPGRVPSEGPCDNARLPWLCQKVQTAKFLVNFWTKDVRREPGCYYATSGVGCPEVQALRQQTNDDIVRRWCSIPGRVRTGITWGLYVASVPFPGAPLPGMRRQAARSTDTSASNCPVFCIH